MPGPGSDARRSTARSSRTGPDALWSRALIESVRVAQAPELARIVVGIDPPASSRQGADACGIVAAGRAEDGTIYVLEDATIAGQPPAGWATRAIGLYRRHNANSIVAEGNQGGEMVRAVLQTVDASVPVRIGTCDPRQISARRASRRDVCAGPRQACGRGIRAARG